jgi:hypothetical protein
MELGFDNESWRLELARSLAAGKDSRPEWHALLARLGAAYAARHALQDDQETDSPDAPSGSFDRGSARIVLNYGQGVGRGLSPVNPTTLVHGKSNTDKTAGVAGTNTTGDRG